MSKVKHESTFIDLVLSGRVRHGEIEGFVERWHELSDNSPGTELEVYEYLGMTWPEYRLWVEQPESLRFIIAARRAEQPVEEVLEKTKLAGAAARSKEHTEAAKVLQWLAARGRISTI